MANDVLYDRSKGVNLGQLLMLKNKLYLDIDDIESKLPNFITDEELEDILSDIFSTVAKPIIEDHQYIIGYGNSNLEYAIKSINTEIGLNCVKWVEWSAENLPEGISIDPETGILSGTLTNTEDTKVESIITVKTNGGTDRKVIEFDLRVPLIPILDDKVYNGKGNTSVSVSMSGYNCTINNNRIPPITTVKWSATNLPSGLVINQTNGAITGTVASAGTLGEDQVATITCTNDYGSGKCFVTFNIIPAPTLTSRSISKKTNDTINETVSGSYITESSNGITSVSWSATNIPTGLTFSNGKFSGTPTATFSKTSVVTVTTNGGTATANITWSITSPVSAPTLNGTSVTKNVGDSITLTMSGTNITKGSNGVTSVSWSATNIPSGLSFSNGKFTGTASSEFSGSSKVTVTTNGGTASAYVTWNFNKVISKPSFNMSTTWVEFPKTTSTGQTVKTLYISGTFDECTFTFSPTTWKDTKQYAVYTVRAADTSKYTGTSYKVYIEQDVKKKPGSNGTEDYKTVSVTAKNSKGSASWSFNVSYKMPKT